MNKLIISLILALTTVVASANNANELLNDNYEAQHQDSHHVIATAGKVKTDTHRPPVYEDNEGTHIQVGGDPNHGIYKNPSEDNFKGMKCSEECGSDCSRCTNDWASYEWYKDHKDNRK